MMDDITGGREGWILRDGTFIHTAYGDHSYAAMEVLTEMGHEPEDAGKMAEDMGWIRVTHEPWKFNTTIFLYEGRIEPTPEQMRTVQRHCKEHEIEPVPTVQSLMDGTGSIYDRPCKLVTPKRGQ